MKKVFSIILSLMVLNLCYSQDSKNTSFSRDNFLAEYVSRTWSAANGLPGNSITDILQDTTGYIYLGTYDGLVRFDGVEFVTYNRNLDEKYSFVSSRVVFEDSRGALWNGSNDEGLYCLKTDGTVSRYSTDEGLPNNSIRAITEDKNGRIWIGTARGVAYIDEFGKVVIPKGLEKFGEENILVSSIYCDTAGRIWIMSAKENGVYIYVNRDFEKFKGFQNFKNPVVTCIMQDKNSSFWMGVAPHYAVKINGDEEFVFNVGHGKQSGTSVNCIFQDKKGNMWFSLDTGVTVIHEGIYSYFDVNNGLADDKVSKIIQDREGNIWFATDRGGIERLSQSKFKTTTMATTINAIAEDVYRGVVWLAGDNGLYCLKKNSFIENEITKLCKNIRIRDVNITKDNSMLISTYEKLGVVIVDSNGNISNVNKDKGLSGNKVRVSIKASDKNIYTGTTTGLNIISKNGSVKTITKKDGISNEYIMCVYEDSDGVIWCGTDGGGIFTVKDGQIVSTLNTENGLIGNVIFKITEEAQGDFWITTGTGLSRYNNIKKTFVNYNSRNGLGADGVFQTITDYTRTVWMTSNKGIFCGTMDEFDTIASGENIKINSKFFGQSDGLISAGVTSTSKSMKDSLGRIWFTLIDGFAVYDPLNVTANKTAPLIKIEEIQIDSEKYDWHGEKIVLAPGVKRLGIKYTGLSFVSSEQNQFKSRLAGFENDYSDWSRNRYVSYTNLAPGTYDFSVIAANGDGVESENLQQIQIVKKPYFYQVIWFWIILVLFISAIVFMIIHHRFARMKRYQIQLENAVQERTKELVMEEEKTEKLLLNILPKNVANELKEGKIIAQKFPNVSVLFTDIVGFTKIADTLNPEDVVNMLNDLTSRFDERAQREGIEKIKTIGDSYMAATGLSDNPADDSVLKLIRFAQGILVDLSDFNRDSKVKLEIRIGINNGNLVAGVIGKTKFIYDVWGDTVNVASRMQQTGIPGKIHVTQNTYKLTKEEIKYSQPVEVDVKGKGIMKSYFVE